MKLHPLHTPEWVADFIKAHGEYPGDRGTGRTTALALDVLACAIQQPGKTVKAQDHHPTPEADRELLRIAKDMASRLGLTRLHFCPHMLTVTFK